MSELARRDRRGRPVRLLSPPRSLDGMSLDPSLDVYSPTRAGNVDGVAVFHDEALRRAEESRHKVKRREKPGKTVFAWGLSHKTKEEEIEKFFER